jgi:peptidoglycan LD-endopeptidase LytH
MVVAAQADPLEFKLPVSGDPKPAVPVMSQAELAATIRELRAKWLQMPISGVDSSILKGWFGQKRGERNHGAVDIMAPRYTPVLAVDAGKIARLWTSKAGGITIYQYDASNKFVYFYAHLDRYADGLKDGDTLKKGQVIGYVGTTGNAPPNAPHLHFSISKLTKPNGWSTGIAIDPYEVFRGTGISGKPMAPVPPAGIWL